MIQNEQIINNIRAMGFFESQKKMVDASDYLFFADHRHHAVFG